MHKSAIILMLAAFLVVPGIAAAGFTDNGNGTVTDTVTNLMWQKCSSGQNNDSTCSGTAAASAWETAIAYCEGLSLGGFVDWRLPNIKELRSIMDSTKLSAPLINVTYFPSTALYYWSSTSASSLYAWYVDFNSGIMFNDGTKLTTLNFRVRCVR